ncbi:LLM class flavin-dependent oxidoreductase [Actinoplanes sp. Pm04-4]|uniref:LLM class flavin-dependent oxidoreductase n=1 Tax=Paractinoplanes pyxinae TaxID=2997416 RepID=A0ABT4BAV4_9ACTN|nr:LLM class flavin-dependent oxidoreductase [Actinoplanes pyxinae]MCY1143645.1 LLM class flavin-dependent oxidoreductase [Actinoplanes pyxinae]
MRFDVFCSLAQTPRPGVGLPPHAELLNEFLDQAALADDLGYGCLWVAESHFSTRVQQGHASPAVPHWTGEIGLNTDVLQLAARVFARTRRIDVGSAIMNVVACGGPLPAAERVAAALAWHGLDKTESRRLNIGFAGGRFDFIARATGVAPRTEWEEAAWPQVRSAVTAEAAEIFVRLLSGEELGSDQVTAPRLMPDAFRDRDAYDRIAAQAGAGDDGIPLERRWTFDTTGLVPGFRPELLRLVGGTHDPALQIRLNQFAPVRVFNLSITRPEVIEDTHRRMAGAYHPAGGPWRRDYMPRTVFVFLDATPGLSRERRRAAARERAEATLAAYWQAMDGTVDPAKVAGSADNALVGAPEDVAAQIVERFHPDDRLMLWFDFFAPDADTVTDGLADFRQQVVPLLAERGVA